MKLQHTIAIISTIAGLSLSAHADIWSNANPGAFDSPGGFVSWDRGTSGSAYAQWDVFYQAEANPNHATDGVFGGTGPSFDSLDLFGNPIVGSGSTAGTGIGASSLTQINTGPGVGAIITSTQNLYSFAGASSFELFAANIGAYDTLVVTVMTAVAGNPIDFGSVGIDGGAMITDFQSNSLAGFETESQWLIDLSGFSGSDATFSWSGVDAHMSTMKISVDAYSVPAPSSLALLGLAGVCASRRRG